MWPFEPFKSTWLSLSEFAIDKTKNICELRWMSKTWNLSWLNHGPLAIWYGARMNGPKMAKNYSLDIYLSIYHVSMHHSPTRCAYVRKLFAVTKELGSTSMRRMGEGDGSSSKISGNWDYLDLVWQVGSDCVLPAIRKRAQLFWGNGGLDSELQCDTENPTQPSFIEGF